MIVSVTTAGRPLVYTAGCQTLRVEFFDDQNLPTGMLELSMSQAEAIAEHLKQNTVKSVHSGTGRELK